MTDRQQLLAALRIPVVAAPMFLVSGPDLVIAASRAGALGSFPAPNCRTLDELDTWMGTINEGVRRGDGTSAPWALNLVTHRTNERLADDLTLVARHQPPVVITALGSPAPVMDVVQGYGGLVVADVVDLRLARKAVAAGVDGLACVSAGAGGHTGYLSPFAFVSAVRDIFDGIICVGGGISDGHGVAGAIASGADLVYMGTRFLATTESMAPEAYKQMVVDHSAEDLVVTDGVTGTSASWLGPSLLANGLDPDALTHDGKRSYNSSDSPQKKWKELWAAGQGLGSIREVQATADVVDELEIDYRRAAERLTSLVNRSR